MKEKILIKNINIVNEGKITFGDVFINNGVIQEIGKIQPENNINIIDGTN